MPFPLLNLLSGAVRFLSGGRLLQRKVCNDTPIDKAQNAPSPFRYDRGKCCYVLDKSWQWSNKDYPMGPEGYLELQPGARIGYFPRFFENGEELYSVLEAEMPWVKRAVKRGTWMQPRMICYMAEEAHMTYTCYDVTNHPVPFTPSVEEIKSRLESFLRQKFNCALNNFYKEGGDYMEFHSDIEPLFGDDPTIASVSFGQARAFDIRSYERPEKRLRYMLGNGDLLVMKGGGVQRDWQHAVMADKRIQAGRINLTFRLITDPE